jgi:proline iminopeptidase
VDDDMPARFVLPKRLNPTGSAVLARLRAQHYDWRQELGNILLPVLVIHGELDPLPVETSRQIASTIPAAKHAVIPDAGHMPFWEAPDVFFPTVQQFL